MMRDNLHNLKVVPAVYPAAIVTGNGVTTSQIIDTAGYESVTFAIQIGATDGTLTPALYAGDASDMSDEGTANTTELIGTVAAATFAATDDNKVKTLGYRGNKRYVRVKLTQASATSGTFIACTALLGHPHEGPTSQ